jgi:hypothetical protein
LLEEIPMSTRTIGTRTLWMTAMATGMVALAIPALASEARADGEVTMQTLPEPTAYPWEIEPHLTFGPGNVYGNAGYGAGLRVGFPFAEGHLGRLPQNLAFNFGGDLIHYDNCYFGNYCGANYLLVPAAAQWNVAIARPVTLFLEAGVFLYKGWFSGCAPGDVGCSPPSDFGLLPTLAFGGRIHLSENVALTMRLGYPTTTLGVSFM